MPTGHIVSYCTLLLIFSVVNAVAQKDDVTKSDGNAEIESLYAVVQVQYYQNFDSTRLYIEKIMQIAEQHQRWADYLQALYNLSWCADYHKQMDEFRRLIADGKRFMDEHSEDLKRTDPDFIHRAGMINATGLYYYSISDYPRAIDEYSKIISLTTKPLTQDSSQILSACIYLAQSYQEIGNFDLSRQYFDLGSRYLSPRDEDYAYRQGLHMMYQGASYFALKEYKKAFAAYRKATTMLERLPYRPRIRNALRSAHYVVAGYYNEAGKYDSALASMNKSIFYHMADDPYYVLTHLRLGSINFKMKKYPTANLHYEKALAITENLYKQDHRDKAAALKGLADIQRALGNYSVAKDLYNEALRQLTNSGIPGQMTASSSPIESLSILKSLGELYFQQSGNGKQQALLDSCIRTLQLGTSFIDGLRKELVNLETKEFIAKESMQLYSLGTKAAYAAYQMTGDQQYEDCIFFFMDKSKSNILLDKALDARARSFAGIPEDVLEKERALLGNLSILQKQFLKDGKEETQQKYLDAQREYLKLIEDLENQFPAYHNLKYDSRTTLVKDVRNSLSPSEALIEYFVTDSVIYVIAIDHSITIVDTVHWTAGLKESVTLLLANLSDPASGGASNLQESYLAFIRNSHHVFRRILHPVLTKLAVKELRIIADGKLCYTPFEVLLTSPAVTGTVDYSSLPYLLRDYEIKYAYSASLGLESVRPRRDTYAFLGFAPSYGETFQRRSKTRLAELAHNQGEVEDAAALWGGQLFIDSAATEKAFKQHASSANILHLAAHAVIDDLESSNSGIALLTEGQDDGYLYTYELYAMHLNADLAILSGCETGIGLDSKGEGLKSLARAFKFAGCNSIVMSLWKVSDMTTKDIMKLFHKNLRSGMEKDQALRKAKLAYLENSPLLSPFYWGAFVLVGDDVPLDTSNRTLPVILISASAFLILAFFIRKKVRRLVRAH